MTQDGFDERASTLAAPRLIGRDGEVELIAQLIRRPDVRLVTITGRSGVGKSVLAATVAAVIEDEDGIGIVRAQVDRQASGARTDEVRAALSLATDGPAGPAPAGRRRVVLLDGLEAASDAPALVAEALAADHGLTVLATSVVPVAIPGEHLLRLDPLPGPWTERTDTEEQRSSPAVQLLLTRIREAGGDDQEVDIAAAVSLTRALDGLPLAIELAAARCAEQTVVAVLAEVERLSTVDVVATRSATPEPHHQSLRATILWSYDLLDDDHQRTLRRLGVFAGSFDASAVERVTEGSADHLPRLVATGLARAFDRGSLGERYELVPSVSFVARELLDAHHELDPATERHAEHFSTLAATAGPELRSAATPEARRRFLADLDDIVATVRHLELQGRRLDALRVMVDLALLWEESSAAALAAQLLPDLLPAPAEEDAGDPATLAEVWALAAMLAVWGGRPVEQQTVLLAGLDRAASRLDRNGDPVPLLTAHRAQVAVSLLMGHADQAATTAEAGLAVARELGDHWWTTQFLGWSAASHTMAGDPAVALERAVEGRDLALLDGDTTQLLRLSHILVGAGATGSDVASEPMSEEDLIVLAQRVDDPHAEGALHVGVAVRAAATGNIPLAAGHLLSALEVGRRQGLWYLEELALLAAVMLTTIGGRADDAARLHGAMTNVLPTLERAIAPESMQLYDLMVGQARATLGDAAFDLAQARGRLLDWEDAIALCAAACDELAHPTDAFGAVGSPEPGDGLLSPRQAEVLAMLALGRTNKEIAAALDLRPKTVMHHTSEIYRRLSVRNRTEAVAEGRRLGLLAGAD